MTQRRIAITGSRTPSAAQLLLLQRLLIDLKESGDEIELLVGDARGIDAAATYRGRELGFKVTVFVADWIRYGKRAGPLRNGQIIAAKPDELHAFPEPTSIGTFDCIKQAQAAGVPAIHVYEAGQLSPSFGDKKSRRRIPDD